MTLQQLQEAAARTQTLKSDDCPDSWVDCYCARKVARAFLDQRPIAPSLLESLGFEDHGMLTTGFQLNVGSSRVSYFLFRNHWLFAVNTTTMDPQPETMGDVAFLLWRLSRESSP